MKLEIKNISKQYGKKTVLQGVSQEFSGGVYGLLGPNGAGKTTLLNIIATVLKASAGTICYEQKNVFDDLAGYHSMVGYLPQKIGFYTHFTGYDMMKYMHYDVKDNKIATYSGGMKQRLGIAQAFLESPRILLLDEPTVGLDLEERAEFKRMIQEAGKEMTVILSTHIVSDVEETADYILVMNEGKVLENHAMSYYMKQIEDKELTGLEQYYLHLTGRKLHDTGNEI